MIGSGNGLLSNVRVSWKEREENTYSMYVKDQQSYQPKCTERVCHNCYKAYSVYVYTHVHNIIHKPRSNQRTLLYNHAVVMGSMRRIESPESPSKAAQHKGHTNWRMLYHIHMYIIPVLPVGKPVLRERRHTHGHSSETSRLEWFRRVTTNYVYTCIYVSIAGQQRTRT